MPTVLRSGPYRFYFHSFDLREPAHVHVERDAKEVKLWLVPIQIARNDGFRAVELGRIIRLVRDNHHLFLRSWNEFIRHALRRD